MDDHTSTNRPHNAPSYDCVYGIWYVMFEFRFLAKNVWQQNGTENMTFLLLPSCPLLTNLSHNESNYSKCFLLSMFQLMYSFLCWTLADRSERSVKTNGIFSPPQVVRKQTSYISQQYQHRTATAHCSSLCMHQTAKATTTGFPMVPCFMI